MKQLAMERLIGWRSEDLGQEFARLGVSSRGPPAVTPSFSLTMAMACPAEPVSRGR
jgi:hypothetical protein